MPFHYPSARRADTVDDYHGTAVPDPYRWLEDPDATETNEFVAAQHSLSRTYLDGLPERDRLQQRMTELWDVPRTGVPESRSGVTVWSHNDGLQDQPIIYVSHDRGDPVVLIDPNTLSGDGTVAVVSTSLAPDGSLLAYAVSEAGSDWQVIRIRDTQTGADLGDELRFVKFTTMAWLGTDGFFYARFPEQDPHSMEPSRNMTVHFHRVGAWQADDELVFANPADPDLGYVPIVTDDRQLVVLYEWAGTSHENGLLFRPAAGGDWTRLVSTGVARHELLDLHDGKLLLVTDLDAPNGRVVAVPLEDLDARLEVIAESGHAVEMATAAAGHLVLVRLVDASHAVELYTPTGEAAGSVDLPGLGTVTGLSGHLGGRTLWVGYSDFLHPPSAFGWRDGVTERFAGAEPPIDPDEIVVERRYAVSTDGARVGMFVLHAGDTEFPAPVELYGYGGFNISLTPDFQPARLAFLEAGGVVAVANLRGGSELGEEWHRQGMLGSKQQVFDDFIACAEQLIEDGIATAGTIGIRGRSNGGLLTAAAMVQRPELFGAVSCGVPVADMLRYQHFTAGRYWTVEYGDAADRDAFEWLIRYSPYHNVRHGVAYPPTLIVTAEGDDRVVPMHAFKLGAALQHAAGGSSDQPLLIRVETRAGHGLGKPTTKIIEERVDEYAFFLHHLQPAGS